MKERIACPICNKKRKASDLISGHALCSFPLDAVKKESKISLKIK